MLSAWLGRNGINGSGGGFPIRVGLNDVNAYWDGTLGRRSATTTAGQWISSLDVVGARVRPRASTPTRPGGIVRPTATQEATGDIFGALTEWLRQQAAANDPPDYQVGEEVNLVGTGPIRYMYNPSLVGDPNCYSSSIPSTEVHAAAGPFNHWFYLVAEGTSPPTASRPARPATAPGHRHRHPERRQDLLQRDADRRRPA